MRMRVLRENLRVEIENEMRVFLESLNFEIEMRVSQKSDSLLSDHAFTLTLTLIMKHRSKANLHIFPVGH